MKIILLFISGILGYMFWAELNRPISLPVFNNTNNTVVAENVALKEIQYETAKITDYDEIINRPLFFEYRKPFVYTEPEKPVKKTKKKKATKPKKTPQYSLSAIIITGNKQLAIIQSGREKALQRISIGEEIDGWMLEEIEPHSILLKKDNETKTLELEVKTSKPQKKKTDKTSKKTDSKKNESDSEEKPQKKAEIIQNTKNLKSKKQ